MYTSVSLANWRTAPYSTESLCNVDQLIPVSRIHAPERVGELAVDSQSLDSLFFEDQHGQERRLLEVLETTATNGLVVFHRGRLVAESYHQGYDGKSPHILFSVSKSLTGATAGRLVDQGLLM